ncbi:MAG: CARDB domain-containing protein, partial [Promethearchaeota archaeon]
GLDLPFSFAYYDDSFDRIYIGSNGWLSFTNTAPWQYSPVPYPTSDPAYGYALAPFWADLWAESNIYAWVTAERVVIQYDDYYYLNGQLLGTFQMVLHEAGIIEFNYLTMESPYYGTVGLNHGNGYHYNSIPYSDLTGATNYGLVFYYNFPGHELAVQLEAPSLLEPGMSTTLNATALNLGVENETLVTLSLYIDEVKVAEEVIPELNASNSYTIQYFWTPPAEASYNVTAYVIPVVNETFTGNNRATINTRVASITLISDFEEADQVFLPTGLWHLADESNPYVETHSPTHSMWYGQDSTGNYDTGYRNFGALISRPYMLGSNVYSLIFWSWYQTEYSGRYYDIKDVYVILPDDSWVLIGYVDGTMNTWGEFSFDISAFADTIVRFAFFFDTVNQYANNYRGWFIDDVSVIGSLSPLDHDLEVVLDISGQVTVDQETEISATAINWGMNTEFSISLDLYIDETLVNSSSIGIFEPLEIHQISYRWTPAEVRYYNITARVSIVPGEVLHSNNRDSQLVLASSERVFLIVEPTSGETVSGGLVFIDLEVSGPVSLQTVYVYLNSMYVFSIYASMSEDFFVPLYQNGTNYISLEGYWDDGMWSYANLSINSINVVPIVAPETGDRIDWLFEPLGTLDYTTLNFTFTTPSGPFSWNIELLITEYDASGSIVNQDLDYQSMNILNGFVESGMWAGFNMFWISGVTDSCEIGDVGLFLQWNDLLVIQDSGMWNGYETWIMEGAMSPGMVFQAFKENGLMCSFGDPYYNYILVYSDFMPGPDSTPPVWITSSAALQFEYGRQIAYQLQATDPSGIGSWDISDNFYFDITSTGVLRSESLVPVGDYSVDVTVADIFGNSDTREFTVLVRDTTGPTWNILPTDQAIESGADFDYLIGAWDLSGIHHWEINDTARFTVNASGGVCNIVSLADGIYGLRVTVYDIYGNINSAEFTLTVGEAPGPFEIPMELIILGTLGIGILAGLLVLVVIRRRMTPRLSD